MGQITMDGKTLRTYKLGCEVIAGKYSITEFATLIGKSYRQSQRIIAKIESSDFNGVIHGNIGRRAHNKTPEKLEALIIDLLRFKYNGFNLTHFQEMLEKNERIRITKSTLHRIANKHDLVKAPRRAKRRSFKPRARMPREGMLVQFDGSDHVWFGSERSDLIAAIDDATGKILSAEFFYGETSMHSMKVIKDLVSNYGIPESFYMDQAGIYGKIDRDWESQISRALMQVNTQLIIASSPQAKGRVERLFRSLQDRLVAELKFYNLVEIDEANEFLKKKFIPSFNEQFGVHAIDSETAYRKNVFGNLDRIFCKKEKRKIGLGNIFSYDSITWMLDSKNCYRGREVNVNTHLDGTQSFDIMGREVKACAIKSERIYGFNKRAVKKAG